MKPQPAPLEVLTRDGSKATLRAVGLTGKIHGAVEGYMTSTWWFADGRHMFLGLGLKPEDALAAQKHFA